MLSSVVSHSVVTTLPLDISTLFSSSHYSATLPAVCAPGEDFVVYEYKASEGFEITSLTGALTMDTERALHGSGWSLELPVKTAEYQLQITHHGREFRFSRIRLFILYVHRVIFTIYDSPIHVLAEKQVMVTVSDSQL